MAHKCFISFKTQDIDYKEYIRDEMNLDMIDKSLNEPINSEDEDYIMRKIREDYLSDSTVTIFLIGNNSAENSFFQNQNFIKRELQASLFNGQNNSKNGILGVVLPSMTDKIFGGTYDCSICNSSHNTVKINDSTVIKEFSYNYYIPNDKCAWADEDRYCVLAKWEDFEKTPNVYIDKAFYKRSEPIANKTKVKP
ncbi:TIR domain-containing protein [Seonamhaeicola sp. ML3]|uniref:TIR domain-containing protein n=1 Tax=Seonamhaeicola sp. ML3 TaxID=2937786 RepID=UPI00200E9830|nr:TIR domain-containing protein [Seonamhaeicola sp. ML3]